MNSNSSIEEINQRKDPLYGGKAKIVEVDKSKIRVDCFILQFRDGSQANVTGEVLNQLNNK